MESSDKENLLLCLKRHSQPRPIYRLIVKAIDASATVQDVVPKLLALGADSRVCTDEELDATAELLEYVIDAMAVLDLQFDSFTSDSRVDLARGAIDYLTIRYRRFIWSSELYSWVDRWKEFTEQENEEIYSNLILAKSHLEGYDPYHEADGYLSSAGRLASRLLESRDNPSDPSSWEEEGYLGEDEGPAFPRLEYTFVNGRRR